MHHFINSKDLFGVCIFITDLRHVEAIICVFQQKPDDVICMGLDLDELEVTLAKEKATYG